MCASSCSAWRRAAVAVWSRSCIRCVWLSCGVRPVVGSGWLLPVVVAAVVRGGGGRSMCAGACGSRQNRSVTSEGECEREREGERVWQRGARAGCRRSSPWHVAGSFGVRDYKTGNPGEYGWEVITSSDPERERERGGGRGAAIAGRRSSSLLS